jgi:membrane fusion protein (multidrug efflux system)
VPDHSRIKNQPDEQLHPGYAAVSDESPELSPEEAESPSRRERAQTYFRDRPHAKWIVLLVVALMMGAGVQVWRYYSVRQSTDDAEIDGHIEAVSARVSGAVISVNVNDNQYVDSGTVLVRLDPKDFQVALDRARAELADAQAAAAAAHSAVPITSTTTTSNISSAQAVLNAARKEVEAAQARLLEAQANDTRIAADLKRAQQLVAKDEISQQQYDAAVAAAQSSKASVDAAAATVASAQSHVAEAAAGVRAAETAPQQIAVTRSRADAADAAVQKFEAAVQQAELNLQYTTVRAPFAGTISKRSVEPGQVIASGQPIFALVNLEDVYVTANFKETQLAHMCPGQPATIRVDTFGHDYQGHVDSLSGATGSRFSLLPPENATGNYVKVVQRVPVKLVFESGQDPNHNLRPGMSVEPTVRVDQACKK